MCPYVYSSDGKKLKEIHRLLLILLLRPAVQQLIKKDSTEYIGNLIIRNGHPMMLHFDGGYVSFDNDTISGVHYYIQDYMGNNRMVVNRDGTIEQWQLQK